MAHVLDWILKCAHQAGESYYGAVTKDPEFTARLETAVRVAAYIIPVYSFTNVFTYFNDYLMCRSTGADIGGLKRSKLHQRLLYVLSIVECFEVSMEMFSQQKLSEVGKWLTVIMISILKTTIRCYMLLALNAGMALSPPVPFLNRAQLFGSNAQQHSQSAQAWQGQRSGRIFRSVHSDMSVPYNQLLLSDGEAGRVTKPTNLSRQQLITELLHCGRPLIHLVAMVMFGQKSWKPWLISLAIDIFNLQSFRHVKKLTKLERSEVLRRRLILLLYLLRSPFYDALTKEKLLGFLKNILSKVPLVNMIAELLLSYIPVWQDTYSYCWMS